MAKRTTKKPRILFYDIESTPNVGYVWGKYEQNVLAYQKERELLCVAYKWQGDSEVKTFDRRGQKTDKRLVQKLHKLLSSADIVVAHNGDSFDAKISKARMLFHGLKPLKRLVSVDTKKAAKSYFAFNGNSLNDLSGFLRLGEKVKNGGFDLWLGCMANDPKSWETMLKYNKQDVVLLEKVYDKLLPWIENHPNISVLLKGDRSGCGTCGSTNVRKEGIYVTATSSFQRMSCNDCGHWYKVPRKK